jgi:uncharacterized protein YggE
MMKTISVWLNAVLVTVLLLVVWGGAIPTARAQATPAVACDASRSVQVSGAALLNVPPDRALIQLGIETNGLTVYEVEQSNSRTMAAIRKALKDQGIEDKDIATDWYVVQPVYEDYGSLKFKGYRISNTVAVTLRDVSKTNAVVAAALNAGANQVANVEFYVSDLRTYRDQARQLAVQAAAEKAQALADAAGADVGCVLHIQENTWSYYSGWWYGRSSNLWTQNTVQNIAPSGANGGNGEDLGPVSLGQVAVRAEVSLTYGLE